MPSPSKTQPEETYGAFPTDEPFKEVARRFGLSPNTLRLWWLWEFGQDAFRARSRTSQVKAATATCVARRVPSGRRKLCTKCGQKKLLGLFAKRADSHDGHACWCLTCWREYQRARDAQGAQHGYRLKARQHLDSLKTTPCVDCGNSFPPCVMDFDHVRGEKVTSVSRMLRWSRERLLAEIAKCDLVCSNCHRLRTHLSGRPKPKSVGRPRKVG